MPLAWSDYVLGRIPGDVPEILLVEFDAPYTINGARAVHYDLYEEDEDIVHFGRWRENPVEVFRERNERMHS